MKFLKYILAPFVMVSLVSSAAISPSQAADPPVVMIIGDSTSSLYNNTAGSSMQGWWSMVAKAKGWTPVVDAEYGSGFLRKGFGTTNNSGTACTGTILKDRIAKIAEVQPDYILVAAGRNDLKKCSGTTAVNATTAESLQAAKNYFAAIKATATAQGIPLSHIYVLTPWGSTQVEESTVIRPKVRDAARSYGLTWITTWVLDANQTTDGLHQNLSGNKSYRDDVLAGL